MKYLRLIFLFFIILSAGTFLLLTAGKDPDILLFQRIVLMEKQHWILVLLISLATVLSTLSGLPVFYLGIGLGFLLGFGTALPVCLLINFFSVILTFYLVRYTFHSYFKERYGQKKIIRRIHAKVNKYGFWTVVFSRAIYIIPTNMINFSFPLSNINNRSYMIGTALGLIPECLINVLTGFLVKHDLMLLSSPGSRKWEIYIISASIFLFLILFIVIRRLQKRKKRQKLFRAVPTLKP